MYTILYDNVVVSLLNMESVLMIHHPSSMMVFQVRLFAAILIIESIVHPKATIRVSGEAAACDSRRPQPFDYPQFPFFIPNSQAYLIALAAAEDDDGRNYYSILCTNQTPGIL